jgi:hypothetical protein
MKNKNIFLVILMILLSSFDDIDYVSTSYSPVLIEYQSLKKSITIYPAREIETPLKINLYKDFILISEKYKGIHIIDNSDPSNPVNSGFLHIPGCLDMAVKDDVVYADNAVDLVSIDISTLPTVKLLDRVKKIFPEPTPPDLDYIPAVFSSRNRPRNTIIAGWELKND